jgi:hypothetical protein
MNVIGHHDEAASEPTVTCRAVEEERNQSLERRFGVEDAGASSYTYRQEIGDVPIAIRPDAMQAAQAAWGWFVWIGDAV